MNTRRLLTSILLAAVVLMTSAFAQQPTVPPPQQGGSSGSGGATTAPGGQAGATAAPGTQAGATPTPEQTSQPAATPGGPGSQMYIIFVMDFSPAMDLPIGKNLPTQATDLAAKLKALEDNQDYIKAVQALNDQFKARPDVAKAKQDNIAATDALNQWMNDHGYELPFPNPNSKFAVLMDETGCKQAANTMMDNKSPNPIYIRYFNQFLSPPKVTIDQVAATVAQVCLMDKVTLTAQQKGQVKALLAFLADPEYLKLATTVYQTNTALMTLDAQLFTNPQFSAAQQQLNALGGGTNASESLTTQMETLTYQAGIPTGLTLASKAGQILGQTALLDRRATGRITTLDAIMYHYEALEIVRDYGTASPMTWISDIIYRGGNNMGEALQVAIDNMPAEHVGQPALIVLLDAGTPNVGMTSDQILSAIPPKARERNVMICSMGFGTQESDTPSSLLKGLADQTGGRYLFVSSEDAGSMLGFVVACRQGLIGDILQQFTGTIKQGETVEAGRITVGGTKQMNVTLTYIEGRVSMDLVDPSGKTVDVSYKNATNLTDQNTQIVTVTDPQPGAWIVRLKGDQVPDTGTAYSVVAAADKSSGPSWLVWVAVALGVLLVGGGIAAYVFRRQLIALVRSVTASRASSPPPPAPSA